MIEQVVEIINPTGLHARPAAKFVQVAGRYSSYIWIAKDQRKVNGKSIIGLMSLAVSKGTKITIGVDGEDEKEAIVELVNLVISGFGEI